MSFRYHLSYHSIQPLEKDFDEDGAMVEVFDHVDEYEYSGVCMIAIESLLARNSEVSYLFEVYVYNGSDLATFYDLATAYKNDLLDLANYLLNRYDELDISITEFASFSELLEFAKTDPQNN
ncbi:MAG TPA: hypothetical protein VM187_05980 [Niastella sp.]|nr:hypothetical protein [Niastella sp.]